MPVGARHARSPSISHVFLATPHATSFTRQLSVAEPRCGDRRALGRGRVTAIAGSNVSRANRRPIGITLNPPSRADGARRSIGLRNRDPVVPRGTHSSRSQAALDDGIPATRLSESSKSWIQARDNELQCLLADFSYQIEQAFAVQLRGRIIEQQNGPDRAVRWQEGQLRQQ